LRRALLAISFLSAAFLIALSVTACSSSDDKSVDDTARSISDQDLAQMILRLEQFPLEYQGFHASDKNGVRTLEVQVASAFDPDRTRSRLEKFGFASSYDASYSNPLFDSKSPGVITVDSEVDLFQTADGAAGDFDQSSRDLQDEIGKTKGEVTVNSAQLSPHELADQAWAGRYEVSVRRNDGSDLGLTILQTAFRRGRLECVVTVNTFGLTEAEQGRLEGRVKDLARQLNDQITHVLSSAVAPSATG